MYNENLSEHDKEDTPWYGRLILGIILILFAVLTFVIFYYMINQLAGLVPSWMCI